MDLKFLKDADDNHHVALSMVDVGASYHVAVRLRNRSAKHVAKHILQDWIAHYGVPEEIIMDQGGEFQSYFLDLCEHMGIDTKLSGAGAAWQNGIAEQHGGILGTIWRKLAYEHDIKGKCLVEIALASVVQAKNATMARNGTTPEQAVFGRSLRFTEATNADDDEVLMGVLGRHGVAWKASQIRTAARMALLERDVTDKVRRARLRKAPTVTVELVPGTRVYFWSAHPMKGRQRQDAERWRGPATVIAK